MPLGRGFTYHLTYSLPYGARPPMYVAGLCGLVVLAFRYWRHGFILLSFAAALYFSLGPGRTLFPVRAATRSGAMHRRRHRDQACGSLGSSAVPHLACRCPRRAPLRRHHPGAGQRHLVRCALGATDSRVLAARWLESNVQAQDTLYDDGGMYVVLDLSRTQFHAWSFDRADNSFGGAEGETPDWLILYDSPVSLYTSAQLQLRDLARREYVLTQTTRATRARPRLAVYDWQDAFFMPLWGFWTVERPGPTIRVYRRTQSR